MLSIGSKNEVLPFSFSTNIDYLSTGGSIGNRQNAQTSNIRVVSLDGFIKETIMPLVGLIKIDVEGFEGPCIEGMRRIIQVARPIFFFECISEVAGKTVQYELEPNGYNFFEIDDEANTSEPTEIVVPRLDGKGTPLMNRLNRIAIPKEKIRFMELL
jgi:hypothetical protein